MRRLIAIIAVLVSMPAVPAVAGSGDLDPSFGGDGVSIARIPPSATSFSAAIGSDGRFVVAGASNGYVAMARFLPDGELDPSFGDGGMVKTFTGYLKGLVILSDGRIVGVGGDGYRWLVCRFTTTGELDASFGDQGIGQLAYHGEASGVALDARGRILVVGAHASGGTVARYRAGGTLDRSFSSDGRRSLHFASDAPGDRDVLFDVASTATGGMVAVGRVDGASVGVVRLDESGHLVRRFGHDGIVVRRLGYDNTGTSVMLRGGRILVGVQYADPEGNAGAVLALRRDGSPDPSFGAGGGIAVIDPEEDLSGVVGMVAHPGGGLVVADTAATAEGDYDPFLTRLDADGAFVTTFGDGGSAVVPARGWNFAAGVALRPDGRIIVGGTHEDAGGGKLLAVQIQG